MRLTTCQLRTLYKLKYDAWQTAYDLRANTRTLSVLCRLGLATSSGGSDVGAMFSPRTTIRYRRVKKSTAMRESTCHTK